MNIKYIVVKECCGMSETENLYMFPCCVQHVDFAEKFDRESVISAGFVDAETKICYGYSDSLGLQSRKGDTGLLRVLLK